MRWHVRWRAHEPGVFVAIVGIGVGWSGSSESSACSGWRRIAVAPIRTQGGRTSPWTWTWTLVHVATWVPWEVRMQVLMLRMGRVRTVGMAPYGDEPGTRWEGSMWSVTGGP